MQKKKLTLFLLVFLCILISKAGYSEDNKRSKARFSLKLTGGFGFIAIGDVNKVLGSVNNNETFEYWREHDPKYIVGKIEKLNNWTPDWEAEFRIDFTPKIGVGIATSGPFRRSGESLLTYTYPGSAGPQVHTFTYKTEIRVSMPVRLNFYYSPNPGARRTIFFIAGIGYYSGKMSGYRNFEMIWPTGGLYSETYNWETQRKSSLGFHAGAGMEYALIKNLALIMEIRGSFARISGFNGTMSYENNFGLSFNTIGALYYFSMWDDWIGARYSGLEVWEKPPELSFRDLTRIRKAILDLSGLSIRIGIKIKLF
jgi:opacity protein-like surface antigen